MEVVFKQEPVDTGGNNLKGKVFYFSQLQITFIMSFEFFASK